MHRYIPDGHKEQGGFSDVHSYQDTHLDRPVAIKTIRNADPRNPLEREISALMQMRSKHVVQVYDIVPFEGGDTGMVMEYIEGKDLSHQDFANLTDNQLLKILWQIASGIADIHEQGLIHRDIKPNNMKMDSEGIVKIFDFGLARPNEGASTLGFKGTQGFAAPELFNGHYIDFTKAIDVYAFGAMALYLLWGRLPDGMHQIPPAPVPMESFKHQFLTQRGDLNHLIQRCFEPQPTARPQMLEIKNLLASYLTFNRHQALAVFNNQNYILNAGRDSMKLSYGQIGRFSIVYNGFKFILKQVSGEVYVNNRLAQSDDIIPGSCVVVFGRKDRHYSERGYVTFDVSSPEVIL